MKTFIKTDNTKVGTEGITRQPTMSSRVNYLYPIQSIKLRKKVESLPAVGSSQSLMKSSAINESAMKAEIPW